jgi:centromeric protein E
MSGDSIQVGIRFRPLNQRNETGDSVAWRCDGTEVTQLPSGSKKFRFPVVFDSGSDTASLYKTMVLPLVSTAVAGYNCTMLVYGQTGSGKTWTMMGDADEPGVTPCAVHDLFGSIGSTPGREFLVRVCYLEVYNEEIRDLLAPGAGNLKLYDDPKRGPCVKSLKEVVVTSAEQALELIAEGVENRQTGSTAMNATSSRSHSVFRVIIESGERIDPATAAARTLAGGTGAAGQQAAAEQRARSVSAPLARQQQDRFNRRAAASAAPPRPGAGSVSVSTVNLVDLAGSERASKTLAGGKQLKEGANINKSLMVLGSVIAELAKQSTGGAKGGHIPFRDSKVRGCEGARVRGCEGARVRGCEGARVRGCAVHV